MVTVCDVERGNRVEGADETLGVIETGTPDRMPHAIRCGEIVQRFTGRNLARQRINRAIGAIREEHDAGLGAQRDDVTRAVVFLVAPSTLVFLDGVGFVLVDRKTSGDPRLLMTSHLQPIEVERGRLVDHERCAVAQRRKVRTGFLVDLRCVGVRPWRKIDLGTGDVQKAEWIAVGKVSRFLGRHDIVRN